MNLTSRDARRGDLALDDYPWDTAGPTPANLYLLPVVTELLERFVPVPGEVFDLGCGNGYIMNKLSEKGWRMTGVDASTEGVRRAREAHAELNVHRGSVYDDLQSKFGCFRAVLSLEVVEHLYAPQTYAARLFDLVEPGGIAIVSTPFHGYWKNLALALSGRLDRHFRAIDAHGHIKFWSRKTMATLLEKEGLEIQDWRLVGRIPILAKSMVVLARRPQ